MVASFLFGIYISTVLVKAPSLPLFIACSVLASIIIGAVTNYTKRQQKVVRKMVTDFRAKNGWAYVVFEEYGNTFLVLTSDEATKKYQIFEPKNPDVPFMTFDIEGAVLTRERVMITPFRAIDGFQLSGPEGSPLRLYICKEPLRLLTFPVKGEELDGAFSEIYLASPNYRSPARIAEMRKKDFEA